MWVSNNTPPPATQVSDTAQEGDRSRAGRAGARANEPYFQLVHIAGHSLRPFGQLSICAHKKKTPDTDRSRYHPPGHAPGHAGSEPSYWPGGSVRESGRTLCPHRARIRCCPVPAGWALRPHPHRCAAHQPVRRRTQTAPQSPLGNRTTSTLALSLTYSTSPTHTSP